MCVYGLPAVALYAFLNRIRYNFAWTPINFAFFSRVANEGGKPGPCGSIFNVSVFHRLISASLHATDRS